MVAKTREYRNHHMDSTLWNGFALRPDDVVIGTYAKSGTTWTQQIVGQILFAGREDFDIQRISPWLDFRLGGPDVLAELDAQTHRRIIKTHLPLDALGVAPGVKYLYIGRDGRDVVFSFHNHHTNLLPHFYGLLNDSPDRQGPPFEQPDPDIVRYFRRWLAEDGLPYWPFFEHVRSWWAGVGHPQVRFVHFDDLKADLEGTMRSIARFLEVEVDEALWPTLVEHCTFDYMKANAEKVAPRGGVGWEGGAKTFINKGQTGRWRDLLTAEDSAAYEARAAAELSPECARWLRSGGPVTP